MYVYKSVWIHACIYVQRSDVNIIYLPLLLSSLCFKTEQALFLNLELIHWLHWLVSQPGRSVSLYLLSAETMKMLCYTQLFTEIRDPNSSPQALYPLNYQPYMILLILKRRLHITQTGLELLTLLSFCWDYRDILLYLNKAFIQKIFEVYGYFVCTHVYLLVQHVHAWCIMCVRSALRGQNRMSDPLELKLQMVVGCSIGTGNQTQVLWKNSHCSYPLNHLSSISPHLCIDLILARGYFLKLSSIKAQLLF